MVRLPISLHNPVPQRFRGFRPRVWLVISMMGVFALTVGWRAYDLQVAQHEALLEMAVRQSQRVIRIGGKRGPIRDSFGQPLAISLRAQSFFAHPARIEEPARTAFLLARVLSLPPEELEARLRSDRPFVWIKRQVTAEEAAAVKALDLKGVGAMPEFRRAYPRRLFAASLLGFTGIDTQGLEGLEYAYDSYLRGARGHRIMDVDALGRTFLRVQRDFPSGGGNLRLTLHPGIQFYAERELARAVERSEAKAGVAIVVKSETGEILAMAQAPAFNPNDYPAYDQGSYFNRAVTSGYEPGSTFKVITAATALEAGTIRPDTLLFCEEGLFPYYDSTIHDTSPHGWLTLERAIRVSSNICAAKAGLSVPVGLFHETITRFGFGRRPGLFTAPSGRRLAGEAEGYVLPPNKWTPVDHAAISFGHGILVSPLQLIMAVNTIATGGLLLKPILVKEIRDAEGRLLQRNQRQVMRRVISRQTAATVRDFMEGVVSEGGTGYRAALAGYRVAGKTGTTEKYDIKARGYSKTRHIASFVGFLPAGKPALTLLVLIEEPLRGRYGGVIAAPVFRDIAARALPLLGIWPKSGVRRLPENKVAEN
ncbi:MAG: penicillin-binding protein 2 [SAR324 cluster bacterium]|nr:penicillin-binding protein 2 [SAR324 cluster bacterium]